MESNSRDKYRTDIDKGTVNLYNNGYWLQVLNKRIWIPN